MSTATANRAAAAAAPAAGRAEGPGGAADRGPRRGERRLPGAAASAAAAAALVAGARRRGLVLPAGAAAPGPAARPWEGHRDWLGATGGRAAAPARRLAGRGVVVPSGGGPHRRPGPLDSPSRPGVSLALPRRARGRPASGAGRRALAWPGPALTHGAVGGRAMRTQRAAPCPVVHHPMTLTAAEPLTPHHRGPAGHFICTRRRLGARRDWCLARRTACHLYLTQSPYLTRHVTSPAPFRCRSNCVSPAFMSSNVFDRSQPSFPGTANQLYLCRRHAVRSHQKTTRSACARRPSSLPGPVYRRLHR